VGCALDQLDEQFFFHRIDEWRIGNRPVTLDTFPMIGWTDLERVYAVGGTYRDGFHCSQVLAQHAVAELLGRPVQKLPFDPCRAPIRAQTVEGAVEEFVLHAVSGWFEAGARLPGFVLTSGVADMLERRARDLHAALETDVGLAPEIVMFLLDSRKDPRDVDRVAAYFRALDKAGS
jgi:hypothetical protein